MIKLIGSLLLLSCSFIWAMDFRSKQRKGIEELGDYLELVEHVRMQIEYFSSPLPRIFSAFRQGSMGTMEDIRKQVEYSKHLLLEEKGILLLWLERLGDGYKNDQLKQCAFTRDRLSQILDARTKDRLSKIKTNDAISFLLSVLLILLLV